MTHKKHFAINIVLALSVVSQIARAQTAISSCQTIGTSGSYILTTNLTASGDCLVVTATDVTIDLGGFIITGSGTGNGIIDDGNGGDGLQTGIRIRNGTIQNFANGINLQASIGIVAQKLRVNANSGFGLVSLIQAFVENSFFTNNANGLSVDAGSVVTGNTPVGNATGNGIGVGVCSYLSGNTARNNGNGFVVDMGSTVIGNSARNNTGVGLSVSCSFTSFCPENVSNIIENTLKNNTNGDLLTTGTGCRLIDNSIG